MPHLIISDEQMEGIVRFYAGFPICSGEQVETGASFQFVQVSKLQTRMFPGFFFNLLMFLSPAGGGQLGVGPLSHGYAVPASRLPPRVLSASGRRPAPTDAAAETGRWATSHRDVAAPKGEPSLASPFGGRWCPVGTVQRLTEPAGESGLALARTERASCQPHRPLPWLSPLRARAPRSLVSFWLTPIKGKVAPF